MILKEACIGSVEAALYAEQHGADRIEVCEQLEIGGVTPKLDFLKQIRQRIHLPAMVIIRPRGGAFVYSDAEIDAMISAILQCKQLGFEGIAVGALTSDGRVDLENMKRVMLAADGLSVTFHMAFDEVSDMLMSLEQLVEIGVDRILTKGGPVSAIEGAKKIKELVKAAGDRIIIMPGGGVTWMNCEALAEETGARELHGTKIVR